MEDSLPTMNEDTRTVGPFLLNRMNLTNFSAQGRR
jgi:hypothetical protein